MKRIVWLVLIAGSLAATAAGAGPLRSRAQAPQPTGPTEYRTHCVGWADAQSASPAEDTRPLVWVLDGAGDLKGCSNALACANMLAGEPVELTVYPWSHGYRRLLADQIDTAHAREQGARLAAAVLERKAKEPNRRIVLVGHSAGCAVVLAAGDVMPRDAVDRVLLLAPSVSTGYDVRPTLWSAKEGIDVFCSRKDWVALGFVVRVVGTTDNRSGAAAGRLGFKLKGANALAELEAARRRQHFWTQEVAWTGNTGGHQGTLAPEFMKSYLLPLMTGQ